jgi:hypothetical protein
MQDISCAALNPCNYRNLFATRNAPSSIGIQDRWARVHRPAVFTVGQRAPEAAKRRNPCIPRQRGICTGIGSSPRCCNTSVLPPRSSRCGGQRARFAGYRTARARCRRRLARSFALRRAARSLVRGWREAACFILSIGLLLERRRVAGDREHSPDPLTWLAPRDGFEPSTQRLTAACSTTELPGIRARSKKKRGIVPLWRPEAESNRCTRICSPLHSHSAIRPVAGADIGAG